MSWTSCLQACFGRLHSLDHDDTTLTRETWAERQPVWKFQTTYGVLVITQPSSCFWVFALGFIGCFLGMLFYDPVAHDPAGLLWSLGMWLWGIGALLAGASYQAFGYHLKCREGRVRWTNWLEVIYMLCQQWSINALFAAAAFTSATGILRIGMLWVAAVLSLFYGALTIAAAFVPSRKLLSFEWMCLVSAPLVVALIALHTYQFMETGFWLEQMLAGIWVGLLACMFAYEVYRRAGLTEILWQKGLWFSENDVLHVTLIFWMLAIAVAAPGIAAAPQ